MKKQLLLLLFSLFAVAGFARTVTGTVTGASDGEPLIGVTVMIKGTATGVDTDFDGNYSIEVPNDKTVLNFSYVGMKPQSITVGSQSVINVVMAEDSEVLGEIVVTAMGQTQEKKKLNFAVQSLNSDAVTAGQSANFVNGLQGKVSGVQVATSGGSPNSASQIQIRAVSSINNQQSNEPLFVIDGMPVRGGASAAADINPNDIETMSVLKGAAASALYGQEGANGVILITTKSGKEGAVTVTASGGWEISEVARTPKLQSKYVGGGSGMYYTNSSGGWGPIANAHDQIYDNVGEFLGTGFMQKYDVSISGGNEKFSAYASANYMNNEGVVQNDYRNRLGIFVKGEFKPNDKLKLSLSTNFIETASRSFGNSMGTVYGWSINRNMADYINPATGLPNWSSRYDAWHEMSNDQRINATVNPYFGLNVDDAEAQSTRTIINGQISYEPIKNLVFTGKVGYDKGYTTTETIRKARFSTKYDEFEKESLTDTQKQAIDGGHGSFSFAPSRSQRLTVQGNVNYFLKLNDDFNVNFFLGAEYSETESYAASMDGEDFVLENFYSFANVNPDYFKLANVSLTHQRKNKYGYFGEIRFDYKGMLQLSATGRHDGSSTLVQADPTYFYPSYTGGIIFSELFKLRNSWFSYGKIRGNWAKVGKDAAAYVFGNKYKQFDTYPDGGYGIDPTMSSATDLKPEMTTSWEIGTDLRFFNDRTSLDVAYYSTTVDNQIVTMRVSNAAGVILNTLNIGSIENYGVEATLSHDIIKSGDFSWTANANFSLNRSTLLRFMSDDEVGERDIKLYNLQVGDLFCTPILGGTTTGMQGIDYLRTEDGQVICDENGYPKKSPNKMPDLGEREPNFLLGVGSTFTWKDLSLSFLVDGRVGGDVYNNTARSLFSNGMSEYLAKYRNREIIFNGVVDNGDGTYRPNTTPVVFDSQFYNNYFSVPSNFIEDGSYVRLSYVTVAYDFGKLMKKIGADKTIKGLRASLTGRNLLLLTKYTGSDPQIQAGKNTNGTGSMGIDDNSVPAVRSFNFNVNVTF